MFSNDRFRSKGRFIANYNIVKFGKFARPVCLVRSRTNIQYLPPPMNNIDYSIFRLHIYVISKWLLTQLTHALTAIARVSPYVHSTCTSYVLNAYLYCVYALVGGAISIRDPYICAVSRVCAKESHAVFHRPVVCAVKT